LLFVDRNEIARALAAPRWSKIKRVKKRGHVRVCNAP
jgi:hypothetical protein